METEISALLDGEVSGPAALPLVDHLLACSDCARFYRGSRRLAAALPTGGRLSQPAPSGGASRPWLRWALPAAAAALLAVGVFGPARRAATQAEGPIQVEVAAASDIDRRHLAVLTAEVLAADRRYHRTLLTVLEDLERTLPTESAAEGEAIFLEGRLGRQGSRGRV